MPVKSSNDPSRGLRSRFPFPVVGIGASAGGLEAFTALLEALPADTGMAFLLVQHLDPAHESLLPALLAKVSAMPVREAVDGEVIEPNHVYVAPSAARLTVRAGALRLLPRKAGPENHLPIDGLLDSLAQECQSRAIAVILSGTGVDGTRGVRSVKAAGGVTLVQDPYSAKFPQMCDSACASGSVDFELAPAGIAAELVRLGRQPYLRQIRLDPDPGFAEVCQILSDFSGVDLHLYKAATLQRRVERRMTLSGQPSFKTYVAYLRETPVELERLRDDVFIHATRFFRDSEALDALRQTVLRQLAGQPAGSAIRIWCAGCSSGEEVYSIAMLLLEELGERAAQYDLKVIGTDVSESAVKQSRAAIYLESSMADVSPERRARFFEEQRRNFRVTKEVRQLCLFARHDFTKDPAFSKLDLVVCRNVLIYLGPTLQRRAMEHFHYALKPEGHLLLGKSESANGYGKLFAAEDARFRIFLRLHYRARLAGPISHSVRHRSGSPVAALSEPAHNLQKDLDRLLLERYAPAALVVGPGFNILHLHGRTAPFLAPASGEPSFHLLRMLRAELVVDLHQAVQQVFQTRETVRREAVSLEVDGRRKFYDIVISPMPSRFGALRADADVLILFQTAALPAKPRARGKTNAVAEVERQLAIARHELVRYVSEHETSREELQAIHHDALSVNEELQTTNEELETAKEELQSSYQELLTLTEEMQVRSAEQRQLTADLNSLLEGVDLPVVILDSQLRIRRFTPPAESIFHLIASDVGRPFAHLAPALNLDRWEALLCRVRDERTPVKQEVQDQAGHWYNLRIHPHPANTSDLPGLLITLTDIHAAKVSLLAAQGARDDAQSAMRTKSEFLSTMSHEIRTPLHGILGMASLTLGTSLSEEQRGFVGAIERSANVLMSIINDILDFSKGEAGKLVAESVSFDLRSEIEDAVELLALRAEDKALEIVVWYPAGLPHWFLGDPLKIRQIVMNLLANAIKFTHSGYVLVEVGVTNEADGRAEISLALHDTGIGIEATKLAELFEKFTQVDASDARKYGGTGLGLAISKQLAELMGGNIAVNSTPGEGTTFWVRLPLAMAAAPAGTLDPPPDLTGRRGLVLDTHTFSRFVTVDVCTRAGLIITEANSLPHAEAILSAAHAAGQPMDVIVLDGGAGHPQGEDPLAAIRRLPGYETVPIIRLRPIASPESGGTGREISLLKPVRPKALLEALHCTFAGPAAPTPAVDLAAEPNPLAGLRVLLAEDNVVNQKVALAMLTKLGCTVELAVNGLAALQIAACGTLDLVLMDCQMPEMDGFETTRSIRRGEAGPAQVPIVALTAGILDGDRDKCTAAGMDDFLAKPFTFASLRAVLIKWQSELSLRSNV